MKWVPRIDSGLLVAHSSGYISLLNVATKRRLWRVELTDSKDPIASFSLDPFNDHRAYFVTAKGSVTVIDGLLFPLPHCPDISDQSPPKRISSSFRVAASAEKEEVGYPSFSYQISQTAEFKYCSHQILVISCTLSSGERLRPSVPKPTWYAVETLSFLACWWPPSGSVKVKLCPLCSVTPESWLDLFRTWRLFVCSIKLSHRFSLCVWRMFDTPGDASIRYKLISTTEVCLVELFWLTWQVVRSNHKFHSRISGGNLAPSKK